MVRRDSAMAVATPRGSPRIRVTSLASMAMSVPVPMAMPTSAWARAGASLMPSPTMATTAPSFWSRWISATLPSGRTSATTRSIPASRATASAVRRLSPVRRTTSRPIFFSRAIASCASGLIGSATARTPAKAPSMAT